MRKIYYLLLCFCLCFTTFSTFGQNAEIRGVINDKETGQPLIYTPVILKGIGKGATSDLNGYYSITKLSPGTYTLFCTSLGFDSFTTVVTIKGDEEKITANIYLQSQGIQLKEVRITKARSQNETRAGVSKVEISPRQIELIPSIGGEPDIAQYLQVVPGVVFSGDQGGQFYIRGGSPVQNMVLLDGMVIYNPFHSIGLFSVFDVDIIRNVDVYTGGFDASYGGRVSGIMDITTRDGNKVKYGGKLSVSPFTSKLLLEGPLKKFKEGKGSSSFLFTARTSYLQQTAPVLYPYASGGALPYNFTDLYGKLSFNAAGGTNMQLFGFHFTDRVDFPQSTNYKWDANGIGGKVMLVPPTSSTIIEGHFAFSDYSANQLDPDQRVRKSSIGGFQAGLDFTYYPNKDMIKYGFELNGFKTNFSFYNSANRLLEQVDNTTQLAGYIRYNKVIGRLIIDPSFRYQYYASLGEASPEPRIAAKFVVTPKFRLKGAAGLYSQNLLSAQSDRDVVNLFYGFLSGPDQKPVGFDGNDVQSRLQKAQHLITGFEADLTENITFQAETYIKYFNQLTNINRNKIFDDTEEFKDKPAYLKKDYIFETSKAYGIDFLLTYDRNPFYLYVVYSLSKVTRFDGRDTYFPHWDRRHNINVVSSYAFGKKKSWELSARWNFGSGFPFTQTGGFYEYLNFQDGVNTDYLHQNGDLGILYSDINGGRLSSYHRLDLSLRKAFKMKKNRELKVVFSVINTYNRDNIFYFDRVAYERVNQLPILPSIAINYSF